MKTAGEVLGELLIGCVRALTPEEREKLYIKQKLQGKIVEFILPDEHEACVVHFIEDPVTRSWVSYKSYPTPRVKCKNCKWKGVWSDLKVEEEEMDLTGKVSELDLFRPIKKTVIETCTICGGKKLKYEDWKFEKADLIIKGTFADIGAVAEITLGGFFHRLKQLFKVMGMMMKGQVSVKPLRKLSMGILVSRLLTGKVSEDYKED